MNFALIGGHPDVLPLLGAISENEIHHLQFATCLNGFESEVLQAHPSVKVVTGWDQLLTESGIDTFILAGNSKESQTAARTIASECKTPFIVFPVLGEDWTAIYDFTYIQDESAFLLMPVLNFRFHPLSKQLKQSLAENVIGKISRVEFQQELSKDKYPQSLSQDDWDPFLLHGIDFLKFIGGNYHRITSIPGGVTASQYSMLNLTLTGDSLPDSHATFCTEGESNNWQLKIKGTEGEIHFSGNNIDFSSWKLNINDKEINLKQDQISFGKSLLEQFEKSVEKNKPEPAWPDLTYCYELLLGSHRSIKRSRTIEVHHDTTSERSQFKTQMTAIGCGLLLFTLGLMIGLMILGNILDPRETIEIQAEAANSIIHSELFVKGDSELTEAGKIHLSDIASRFERIPFPILIEQTGEPDSSKLDESRREVVLKNIQEQGIKHSEKRIAIAKVNGGLFILLMKIGRILIFAPLFIFLGFQFLLRLARPSAN
jgi:hypothetical protein